MLNVNHFNVHSFADTFVVNSGDSSELSVEFSSFHAVANLSSVHCLGNECLFVSGKNSFTAELDIADCDCLHGRSSSFGKSSNCVSRHMGALIERKSTLSNLHSESHASGVAAFLAVCLRCEFENIKTF